MAAVAGEVTVSGKVMLVYVSLLAGLTQRQAKKNACQHTGHRTITVRNLPQVKLYMKRQFSTEMKNTKQGQ